MSQPGSSPESPWAHPSDDEPHRTPPDSTIGPGPLAAGSAGTASSGTGPTGGTAPIRSGSSGGTAPTWSGSSGGTAPMRTDRAGGSVPVGTGPGGGARVRGSEPIEIGGGFGAGNVTGWSPPTQVGGDPIDAPIDPAAYRRRTLRWFAGAAGGVVTIGVVVLLALVLTGRNPLRTTNASRPPDVRSQIAKLCPPPSDEPAPQSAPPIAAGPRTVDSDSGISYKAYGSPWHALDEPWVTGGELGVVFRSGQSFITEYYPEGTYNATILSGSVPATTNDALSIDLKCTAEQVGADVRARFYPQPNTLQQISEGARMLGGRPGWLYEFRLHFHEDGLKATSELVAIAVLDIGKPTAAILYVSIPGTVDQYDYVIDELLASVRPTG